MEERAPPMPVLRGDTFLQPLYVPDDNVVAKAESSPHRLSRAKLPFQYGIKNRSRVSSTNSTGNLLLEKQERKEVEVDDDSFLWIEGSQAGDESDFGFSPLFGASSTSMEQMTSIFDLDERAVSPSSSRHGDNVGRRNSFFSFDDSCLDVTSMPQHHNMDFAFQPYAATENVAVNNGVNRGDTWEEIASRCDNRTAKQCSQQWRKIVKTTSVHELPWTETEDDLIRKGVAEKLSWQEIAKLTKRRLSRQCSQRWRKVLDPSIKRFVKWTSEEDAKLIELHKKFPTMSNKEMSTYLPGRTSTQCHNRWVEVLNPDLRRGAFSKEEDDCILRLRKNGLGWSAMAKDAILNGRANVALKNRWHTLNRRDKRLMSKRTLSSAQIWK